MRIDEWMVKEVYACRPETDLNGAARLMWEHDCGCLPVVDVEDRLVGIVTDRDVLMGAYTQGRALGDLHVSNCMTQKVMAALPSDTVEDVIRMMGDHQVRRIPVVEEQGKLVGLISLSDLVRHTTESEDSKTRANLSTRLLEALECVCESRRFACELPAPVPTKKAERTSGKARVGTI